MLAIQVRFCITHWKWIHFCNSSYGLLLWLVTQLVVFGPTPETTIKHQHSQRTHLSWRRMLIVRPALTTSAGSTWLWSSVIILGIILFVLRSWACIVSRCCGNYVFSEACKLLDNKKKTYATCEVISMFSAHVFWSIYRWTELLPEMLISSCC